MNICESLQVKGRNFHIKDGFPETASQKHKTKKKKKDSVVPELQCSNVTWTGKNHFSKMFNAPTNLPNFHEDIL